MINTAVSNEWNSSFSNNYFCGGEQFTLHQWICTPLWSELYTLCNLAYICNHIILTLSHIWHTVLAVYQFCNSYCDDWHAFISSDKHYLYCLLLCWDLIIFRHTLHYHEVTSELKICNAKSKQSYSLFKPLKPFILRTDTPQS